MRQMTSPIHHILFDLDGTLLNAQDFLLRSQFIINTLIKFKKKGSLRRAVAGLNAIAKEYQHPTRSGTNYERGVQVFSAKMGIPLLEASELLEDTLKEVFPSLKRYCYPTPGAEKFIKNLRKAYPDIRLTLATNPVWPIGPVLLRLKWAGLESNLFDEITNSTTYSSLKPSLAYYREILRKRPAQNFLLIGNDERKDLPAIQMGIRTFILSKSDTPLRYSEYALQKRWKTKKRLAPAWSGSYEALQILLESLVEGRK